MSTNQFVLNYYCHVQIHLQEAVFVIQKSLICTRHICEKRFFLNYRHHLQRSERSKCTKKYLWMWSTMNFKQNKKHLQKKWSYLHTLMKWLSTLLLEFWKFTIHAHKSLAREHDAKSAASNSKIWFHCYFCGTYYYERVIPCQFNPTFRWQIPLSGGNGKKSHFQVGSDL